MTEDMVELIKKEVLLLVTTKYAVIDSSFFSLIGINIGQSLCNLSKSNVPYKGKARKISDMKVSVPKNKRKRKEDLYCGTLF